MLDDNSQQISDLTIAHMVLDQISWQGRDVEVSDRHNSLLLGGAGAYAAIAQALVSGSSSVCCGLGKDFPNHLRDLLDSSGVSLAGVEFLLPETPRTLIQYFADGERLETPVLGLTHFLAATPNPSLRPDLVEQARAIYLFGGVAEPWWQVVQELRAPDSYILWELRADHANLANLPAVQTLVEQVEVFSLNLTEARNLFNLPDATPVQLVDRLAELNVRHVLLRCGSGGAISVSDGVVLAARPPAFTVVDPTGAGNACSGAFVSQIARDPSDQHGALAAGMAAAALAISQFGPPSAAPIERHRFSELKANIYVGPLEKWAEEWNH